MQVAGQPAVTYTYDNADRLTQSSQSNSNTSFSYDNANRRTSLTLPNNVVVSYSYDNDSRLMGITYQFGSNTLGNLSYTYDQLGRRTQVGGSFARTGLPGLVSPATYDAANELTQWNGTTISYDANGNLLTDGSNVFTWNARNQVATLNNLGLQYDAFGRRIKNAAGTSFLYDGTNPAQELSGSTVTANLLSGKIDEVFSRTDSSGAFTPLRDALGSMIALVDSNGNLQTTYTYDPFGNTSVTGTANGNEFQYTGRENEGNGLYFYRARYYSPLLGRFISEDPFGFAGSGPNLYSYVLDSPTNFRDPLGLASTGIDEQTLVDEFIAWLETQAASEGPAVTLVAGGSAEGVGAGPIGAVVGAGAAVLGGYGYYGYQALSAVQNANDADQELLQAIHNLNQVLLAGRYSRPKRKRKFSEEDCEEMYKLDRQVCKTLPVSNRPSCYDQAMQRYSSCITGRPIPPFPWRRPQ